MENSYRQQTPKREVYYLVDRDVFLELGFEFLAVGDCGGEF